MWFKVDDGWWSHPKVLHLSDAAQALWMRAGSWSMKHLTDGAIPAVALPVLRAKPKPIAELVAVGLWGVYPDGYMFHDWDKYQPSREKVENEREAAAERQRKSREKSRRDSHSPVPSRPVPTTDGDLGGSSYVPDPTGRHDDELRFPNPSNSSRLDLNAVDRAIRNHCRRTPSTGTVQTIVDTILGRSTGNVTSLTPFVTTAIKNDWAEWQAFIDREESA